MSDFGLFENDEATQAQPRLAAKTAARQMEAAIDVVRSKFGRFLMGATGIDEFGDRWHLSKHDIRSTVEPYVFPNTGTMRRLHNAMKQDWKLAHPYKLAEDRDAPFQDLDETYRPSNTNLIPEGDFEGYKNSVDQDGPEKVQRDFTPGGDSGSDRTAGRHDLDELYDQGYSREDFVNVDPSSGVWRNHPGRFDGVNYDPTQDPDFIPADYLGPAGYGMGGKHRAEAARLVADIYTDFARSNGLRVASLDTLNHYAATGIHEDDYRLLESMIVRTAEAEDDCECDDDDESEESGPPESDTEDGGNDGDSDSAPPQDDDSEDDDSGEDDTVGDEEEPAGGGDGPVDDGGDDGFPGDDQGDQTFTVPDQAPELDPRLQQEIPQDDQGGSAPVPPEVIDSILGLPEGTIEQLLLEEVEQGAQGGASGQGGFDSPPPTGPGQSGPPQGGGGNPFSDEEEQPRMARRRQSARSFWAAEGDEQQQAAPPQQGAPAPQDPSAGMDPSAMSGGDPNAGMAPPQGGGDPSAMGGGQPPAPQGAPQAAPAEDQPAEDQLLDMASNAVQQMIERETQEYQQIVDPLTQALQAIQFAQQIEQAEHPLDVTPPEGSVDVSPAAAPGGAQSLQQQASRRQAIQTHPSEEAYRRSREDNEYAERVRNNPPTHDPIRFSDEDVAYLKGLGQNPDQAGGGFSDWDSYHKYHGASRRQAKVEKTLRDAAAVIANRYRLSRDGYRMLVSAALSGRGYSDVAEALKVAPPRVRSAATQHVSHLLAAGNPQFRREAFLKAVLGSNPRDRAGDVWRDGRDRGIAEHGRHDLDDFGDELGEAFAPRGNQRHRPGGFDPHDHDEWVDAEGWTTASRGRHPFDSARRTAGETWINTPVQDSFEFENDKPRVSDNMTISDLPKMPGGHIGRRLESKGGVMERFQRWQQKQQERGLNFGDGDIAAEGFVSEKNVGPGGAAKLHRELGISHPPGDNAVKSNPKPSVPKAKNPVTKRGSWGEWEPTKEASFFTRRVPDWKWDDHLSGYISKEGKAFTCSCGQKVAAPSYKTCSCGKVWNITALGSAQHLASDTADFYVAREIPVRPGVILASKDMESGIPSGNGEMDSGSKSERVRGVQPRTGSQRGSNGSSSAFWPTDSSGSGAQGEHSGQPSRLSHRSPGAEQYQDGSLTGGPGLPRTSGGAAGSSPERRSARQPSGESGLRDGRGQHGGHGSSRDAVAAAENALSRRASSGGTQPGSQPGTARVAAMPSLPAGTKLGEESPRGGFSDRSGSVSPDNHGIVNVSQKSQRELLAEIERLADWTKYDDEDPARQGGPKKPPSTSIPKQPKDWAKRDSNGTWQGPAIPRKKK